MTTINDHDAYNARRETRGGVEWSPQQREFLDWCDDQQGGSCVLVAVAGAGKTTVLIEGGRRMRGGGAYMAYNRKIVDETNKKLTELGVDWKKLQANTAHGFGRRAYVRARPGAVVDGNKVIAILDELAKTGHPLEIYKPQVAQLVSLAKQSAMGITSAIESLDDWYEMADHYDVFDDDEGPVPLEDIVRLAIEALRASIAMMDKIDFDDMIYMPLYHKVRFWQHDFVMIDEAQDTNASRRALVRAMLRKGGRVVAVGDPHQAIYGFTGADADSLDLIARDFSCRRLYLTVSFRCPRSVVAFAQRWVSHITSAPAAAEGSVSGTSMVDFMKRNDLRGGSAVLCRVKKPLVLLAFALIRQKTPCLVEGRDIGKNLQRLMTRWKVTTLDQLEDRLESYLARETTKLLAKKKEARLQEIEDAVETIRVIVDQCRSDKKYSVQDAVDYVDTIFGDDVQDVLVLSTIHKAKGREWERVFWLDRRNTCPSKWARQDWQQQQEVNLMYVAATRSKDQLIELEPATEKRRGR